MPLTEQELKLHHDKLRTETFVKYHIAILQQMSTLRGVGIEELTEDDLEEADTMADALTMAHNIGEA